MKTPYRQAIHKDFSSVHASGMGFKICIVLMVFAAMILAGLLLIALVLAGHRDIAGET